MRWGVLAAMYRSVRRRQFTRDFKREAVRQVLEAGRSAADVARELGVRADQVRRWKRLAVGGAIRGVRSARREELGRVRRAIARLRSELAILERAAALLSEGDLTVS